MVKSALKTKVAAEAKKVAKKTVRLAGDKAGEKVEKVEKKQVKKTKKAKHDKRRGVVYIGHIPHGYYEEQMRRYLQQYGQVLRLRLARSKKTGKVKGYGFVQFESDEVAEQAAEELNGLYLTGKVLDVHTVAPKDVHKNLWRSMKQKKLQELDEDIRVNGPLFNYQPPSMKDWKERLLRAVQTERKINGKLAKQGIKYCYNGFQEQMAELGVERPIRQAPDHDKLAAGVLAKKRTEADNKSPKASGAAAPKKASPQVKAKASPKAAIQKASPKVKAKAAAKKPAKKAAKKK